MSRTHDPTVHQRRTVRFRGQVQGVGFRFTAQQIAGQFDVSGYVRNVHDGSVEMVVEGDPGEVERFVAAVRERMRRFISDVDSTAAPATGEFDGFDVRH